MKRGVFACRLRAFVVLCGAALHIQAGADERPNIIFFLVDDLGARDLSCYGSTFYETPHMDRLAAEGMRFTDAYAAYPRCVPSRQAIFSGKYPSRVEHQRISSGDSGHALPLSEVTFGEVFQRAGYRTGYIGKWHLGDVGGGPGDQGFQTVIHAGAAGATGSFFHPFTVEKGRSVVNPLTSHEGDYLVDRMTDEAVNYVEQQSGQPFLLVVSHYAVHTPLEAPEELSRKYEDELRRRGLEIGGDKEDADLEQDRQGVTKTLQNNPTYAAMIGKTDESLGRIMRSLEKRGLNGNTIVVVTSDHGGLSTRGLENRRPLATSNVPFRQGKGSIFEGGIRVPLIVKWPGRTVSGSVSGVQVNGTDHYPTLLEMAGLSLMPDQHVDGVSYRRALQGEVYERPPIFFNKWMARPKSTGDTRALSLIEGRWKLIQWLDEDLVELFDLRADAGETTNLAGEMPERTAAMLATLLEAETSAGNLRERGLEATLRRTNRE